MPVRPASRSGRPTARKAAPAKTPVRSPQANLKEYKTREATPYHKAFAGYLVREVGLTFASPAEKKAFLLGIRLAITTRNIFNASDYIEEWRERTGETKRGRKPAEAAAPAGRKRRPAPEPELEPEEEEEEEEEFEEDESDDDDDFEEDFEEDGEGEDDDDDFEEEQPAPAPRRPAPKSRSASGGATRQAPVKGTTARKAAPAGRKPKPATDDDEFIF